MLQPEWVIAVTAIGRSAAGLHIGCVPGLWTDSAQKGCGMKGASAHRCVVGLHDNTTLVSPIVLQCKYEVLKGHFGLYLCVYPPFGAVASINDERLKGLTK